MLQFDSTILLLNKKNRGICKYSNHTQILADMAQCNFFFFSNVANLDSVFGVYL